jgi:hypothetical protein
MRKVSAPKVAGPESVFLRRSCQIYSGMKARAKKLHAEISFSLADFRVWLLARFSSGGMTGIARCEYSGSMLLAEDFSVDHRFPVSRGGSFALPNLALCTEKENLRKGNMSEVEYGQLKSHVERYAPEVQAAIWRKLEIDDVQRFSHFRRQKKERGVR